MIRAVVLASVLGGCVVGEPYDPDTNAPFDDLPAHGSLASSALLLGGFPARADFANPSGGGSDPSIVNEVIRLVKDAEPGSRITADIHSLNIPEVAFWLAARHDCTVDVVEDGSNEGNTNAEGLAAAIGPAHHKFCKRGGNNGCITTDGSGIMHSKLFTFSSTKAEGQSTYFHDVVWIGSANMTPKTGLEAYNNAVTVYGDHDLYAGMTAYHDDLWNLRSFPNNDYYEAPRGFTNTASARVYASPENTPGAPHDLVEDRLNDIEPGPGCRVRVAENMIHKERMAVTQQLAYLAQNQCDVRVVVKAIDQASFDVLHAAGIPVRYTHVHDKFVIAKARFANSPDLRYMVFTGSHNLTESANSKNDELFVRYESQDLYGAFIGHFVAAWNDADKATGAVNAADAED